MSLTQSPRNNAVIACAGSGKTTFIVSKALSYGDKRVLIVTYTNENVHELEDQLRRASGGGVPPNIEVLSWFVFLLRDGIRPYQNHLTSASRVRTVLFETKRTLYKSKDQYFTTTGDIYSDKASEFAYEADRASGGLVARRLARIYEHLFIDEVQDLAGYDLAFLQTLLQSPLTITVVGDPRQATFATNHAAKNKKYRGSGIYEWLLERQAANDIALLEKTESFRCNQAICDFADAVFPEYPTTVSGNRTQTGHDGVFKIAADEVSSYVATHNPTILRDSKKTPTQDLPAVNIGTSKGRTFDRVLLFPTKTMNDFLHGCALAHGSRVRLYVAITRARFSFAVVMTPVRRPRGNSAIGAKEEPAPSSGVP